MVVLRFCSDEVRRSCSDLARMRSMHGDAVAHQVSRRLQQLEAMTALSDLDFLPFDSSEHDSGTIEVAVNDRLALFIEPGPDDPEGEGPMNTLTITGLRGRSKAARRS